MKLVKVKGGIGNQLFQYAFATCLRDITGEETKLDMSSYQYNDDPIRIPRLLKFNISIPIATQEEVDPILLFRHKGRIPSIWNKIEVGVEATLNKKYYFEKNRGYTDPNTIRKYSFYDGYWQSWKIVDKVWNTIRRELVPNYNVHVSTQDMIDLVSSTNSVFIGIRRGDYATRPQHFGSFGDKYYQKAMNYVSEHVKSPVFYVFSNDIPWVKDNINFNGRTVVFREPEDVVDDFEDLLIMAACKHSIIINSTYHWWGARLNDYTGKIVVVPNKWFFDDEPIDIIPPHWTKIEI